MSEFWFGRIGLSEGGKGGKYHLVGSAGSKDGLQAVNADGGLNGGARVVRKRLSSHNEDFVVGFHNLEHEVEGGWSGHGCELPNQRKGEKVDITRGIAPHKERNDEFQDRDHKKEFRNREAGSTISLQKVFRAGEKRTEQDALKREGGS